MRTWQNSRQRCNLQKGGKNLYLHVGSETILTQQNIIGIFDIENTSVSKYTREFLRKKQQDGRVVNVTDEIPKSFVVCYDKESRRESIYLSQLAAATLKKRSQWMKSGRL